MIKEKFVDTIECLDKVWQNIDIIEKSCCLRLDDDSPYWKMADNVVELLSIMFDDDDDMISWYCPTEYIYRPSKIISDVFPTL